MDLLRDVKAYIDQHHLITSGDRIVVGVSGGPDSIALLHLLHALSSSLSLELHVAHLNHGIRGEDAAMDMHQVQNISAGLGLPCSTAYEDIPEIARQNKTTLEETARQVRYDFFCRIARQIDARIIAVGHNADDQAETILMHLLRGAGPAGLRGMLPATRMNFNPCLTLIRPLLGTTREQIETYCTENQLDIRTDLSNLDTTYFRNRLRHEVLPYLDDINPGIYHRLVNLGEVVRGDYQLIQEFTQIAWDTLLVAEYPDSLRFELSRWREQPLAIQRAIIRKAVNTLCSGLRDLDFHHIEQAVRLILQGQTGAVSTLPNNLMLTVEYTTFTIGFQHALHLPLERPWIQPGESIAIKVPGITPLSDGWTLHTQVANHWNLNLIAENPDPLVAWIDGSIIDTSPVLRTRMEGDRFHPQGMHGEEVRLSDFLINIKLPRRWRDRLPLVVSQDDLIWIPGFRLSEKALVRADSKQVIYMRFRSPGTRPE